MKDHLTHLDNDGRPMMVDVGDKLVQQRRARAEGKIFLQKETLLLIKENKIKKGNVLTVSEIAGIMAAKKTHELIPLCHPLQLSSVKVKAEIEDDGILIEATVKNLGQTGVEMEALTGVQVALLTIYDMCKAVDKKMMMGNIVLLEKEKK